MQVPADAIQGGAGTSANMNMNMNEVVANRANELLGGKRGAYDHVHPNDHVNMSQSTNDVIPTAGKLTVLDLLQPLMKEYKKLRKALLAKKSVKIGKSVRALVLEEKLLTESELDILFDPYTLTNPVHMKAEAM